MLDRPVQKHPSLGWFPRDLMVLLVIDHMGMLCPKGVPFSLKQHVKRWGFRPWGKESHYTTLRSTIQWVLFGTPPTRIPYSSPAPGYLHATATLFRLSKHHLSISFLFESEEFTRKGVKILQYRWNGCEGKTVKLNIPANLKESSVLVTSGPVIVWVFPDPVWP